MTVTSYMFVLRGEVIVDALSGKIAFVTGSSRGIGAAIAARFAKESASVVIHGRDKGALEMVASEIRRSGGQAFIVTGDVTRFDDIERAREQVQQEVGLVDILVANAGGNPVPPGPLEDIREEGWRATLDANLTATFLTIKCFLPGMKARGRGTIITISSAAARRPDARSPIAYAAAKAGIELLTQDVAAQAVPAGVRVNCIAPETILTARNKERIPADQIPGLIAVHPLRRLGTPDDIAEAALFLANDASSWITGIVLDVAGGAVTLS